jgi:hypothetical protein
LIGFFSHATFVNGGETYGAVGGEGNLLIVWFQNLALFAYLYALSLKPFPIAALRDLISLLSISICNITC